MHTVPNRPRILIVDDSREDLRQLTDFLRRQQYQVSAVGDGREGYQQALATRPDLILMDVQMPDLDGFAACRLLKANPATAHIPVIFLTALDEPDYRVAGLVLGGVDYVVKPYNPAEVTVRVRIHLDLAQHAPRAGAVEPSPEPEPPSEPVRHNPDQVLYAAATRMIAASLGAPLTLADIAHAIGTHEKRLAQVFRQCGGVTVFAHVAEQRIACGRQLLATTDLSIQDIATRIGYRNAGNFATAFRERMQMTPSAYRQGMQQSEGAGR